MKTYLLIVHIASSTKLGEKLAKIGQIVGKAQPLCGGTTAFGIASEFGAVELARKISDVIHGADSFLLVEAGKDWAAGIKDAARTAWLYQNVNKQEFLGESRVIQRG